MAQKERKTNAGGDGRQNRTILGRTICLMAIFGVVAFIPLLWKLWQIQIVQGDYYQEQAIDQQTRDMLVTAPRGSIYDSQGNLLAVSTSVQNVVISPKDIASAAQSKKESGEEKVAAGETPNAAETAAMNGTYQGFLAERLAEILDLEEESILKRMNNTASQYEVLKWRVEDEVSDAVREFQEEYGLYPGVYLMPDTKRVYPYGSLAAQVIGWVNTNTNMGAFGVEAKFEDKLAGSPGRVVTAKNARGEEMLSSYESYIDGEPGMNVQLTIDATIQSYCERTLAEGISSYEARKGGFCIVMDPDTGAILAMASSPNYDLNDPRTISDPVLSAYLEQVQADPNSSEDAYLEALEAAQYQQWTNRTITDTYEPGSTFKVMVLAAALEEGVVNENSTFYCPGYKVVADWTINCHKHSGHGEQNLAEALSNSCNPAFIEIGQALGAERFYEYLKDFGIIGKTGIDLQGETDNTNLVWSQEYFTGPYGDASLATASFGQTFRLTPIQLITAASAAVNGGHLMEPYIVQSVTDSDGNVVSYHEPQEVRQVISQETSSLVLSYMESVVNDVGGTGKNAKVDGYRIAGKTGSSQTLTSEDRIIVSFLGCAPADDPEVIVLLGYDWPEPSAPGQNTTDDGIYISGGNMAAPMAGELIANIMDYLGYDKTGSSENENGVTIPYLIGETAESAQATLNGLGLNVRFSGEGSVVTDQMPTAGSSVPEGSSMVLYLGEEKPSGTVEMPDLSGMTYDQAVAALEEVGLYLNATGTTEGGRVFSQGVSPGDTVTVGASVEVRFTADIGSESGLDTGQDGNWVQTDEEEDTTTGDG